MIDLTITEESDLKGRALRKWKAEKKVDKIVNSWMDVFEKLSLSLSVNKDLLNKDSENIDRAIKTHMILDIRRDPTNKVLYERAIVKFGEYLKLLTEAMRKMNESESEET